MPAGHISKRSVDAAKPDARDSYLWDDELSGFGLKVTPAGRKVYLVQYRLGGRRGRVRRVTIGVHGRITPEQARTEAAMLGLKIPVWRNGEIVYVDVKEESQQSPSAGKAAEA